MKKFFFLFLLFLMAKPISASRTSMPSDMPKLYETECASCHMAFPPGLLNEKSWLNLMSGLSEHFDTDASLDEKDNTQITNWLKKNSATRKKYRELAPDNRITKTSWFIRKHDEVKIEVWKRSGVKSPSNCMACHEDASRGIFNEDKIRIPEK
jgi:cytochrome c